MASALTPWSTTKPATLKRSSRARSGSDDGLAGRERVRRRGVLLGGDLEPADHAGLPADAGADEQGPAVGLALHDLGEVGAERPADEAAGLVEDRVEVVGAEGELAELRERGLLGQQLLVIGSSPARHDAETRGRTREFLARAGDTFRVRPTATSPSSACARPAPPPASP